MHILDRIHVHVVTPKCALSCQEGNVSLGKKLFTNVDFLRHTVCNSCIHVETFLHMNKKDLYCLYSSMAICILVLQFWWNKAAGGCYGSKVGQRNAGEEVSSSSSSYTCMTSSSSSSEHWTPDEESKKAKAKAKPPKWQCQHQKKKKV